MNIFPQAQEIKVYRLGECQTYACGGQKFEEIVAEWNALTVSAMLMPAYAVSLNGETEQSLASGVWVEFCYSERMVYEGMPFERLVIEVKSEFMGFNVIRYNTQGGYSGRCYYIDLSGNTMRTFYECLV